MDFKLYVTSIQKLKSLSLHCFSITRPLSSVSHKTGVCILTDYFSRIIYLEILISLKIRVSLNLMISFLNCNNSPNVPSASILDAHPFSIRIH